MMQLDVHARVSASLMYFTNCVPHVHEPRRAQMLLQVDAPTPGSRLFMQPLTAPGSQSAFEPLPAETGAQLCAGQAAVRTQFLSVRCWNWWNRRNYFCCATDPHSHAPTHALRTHALASG